MHFSFPDSYRSRFFQISQGSRTRGHDQKIFKPRLSKGLLARKKFFSIRVVNAWNSLPEFVVDSDSVNQLKHNLSEYNTWIELGL